MFSHVPELNLESYMNLNLNGVLSNTHYIIYPIYMFISAT